MADATDPIGNAIGPDGDYLLPSRVGEALSPIALLRLAETIHANRNAAIVCGEEDELDENRLRSPPWFEPGEMFVAHDYLSSAMAIVILTREIARTSSNVTESITEAGPRRGTPTASCQRRSQGISDSLTSRSMSAPLQLLAWSSRRRSSKQWAALTRPPSPSRQ